MAQLGADGRCLMRALQEELDDPAPTVRPLRRLHRAALRRRARRGARARGLLHLRSRPLVLEAKTDGPDTAGRDEEDPEGVRTEEGRALARLGDGGWDPLVRQGRSAGSFPVELVEAAAEAVRTWGVAAGVVAAVPSRRSGELVPEFARRLAERLGLPYAPVLERTGDAPPQREMAQLRSSRSPTCAASSPSAASRPRGPACSWTTSASAVGRWRWSAGNCAAAAARRSTRSRWRRRSRRGRSGRAPARGERLNGASREHGRERSEPDPALLPSRAPAGGLGGRNAPPGSFSSVAGRRRCGRRRRPSRRQSYRRRRHARRRRKKRPSRHTQCAVAVRRHPRPTR